MASLLGPSASDPFVPVTTSLRVLTAAARKCTACPLYRHATQTVFGEGSPGAEVMMVGEQPGDAEDIAGRPFVGAAGRILAQTLDEIGIERGDVYITNAVKHFKFERRGKRRIHDKPNQLEIAACLGWLGAEIELIRPRVIVCLGATAAQAFRGTSFRITRHLGELFHDLPYCEIWMATYHPSALLRMPDEAARHEARARFRADLSQILPSLRKAQAPARGPPEHPPA